MLYRFGKASTTYISRTDDASVHCIGIAYGSGVEHKEYQIIWNFNYLTYVTKVKNQVTKGASLGCRVKYKIIIKIETWNRQQNETALLLYYCWITLRKYSA